ncbi:hypothetical protein ASZ78_003988 [Callipepla squamata]|uniref:Uncharacterized protein n=1 Tax=Callipepla squamata TaxID=9009 RepID=A0A226MFB9_CALSU|nr:hypothetical protein ASZ78_003988 [Callipepla squamata]
MEPKGHQADPWGKDVQQWHLPGGAVRRAWFSSMS